LKWFLGGELLLNCLAFCGRLHGGDVDEVRIDKRWGGET